MRTQKRMVISEFSMMEASRNLTKVLDTAADKNVVIEREDGNKFQVLPIGEKRTKTSTLSKYKRRETK